MKPITIRTAVAAALLATLSLSATAQNLAIVNGKPIPSSRMQAVEAQFEGMGRPITPEIRAQLKEQLISQEVLAQAAEAQGLARTPEFRAEMTNARQIVLINGLRAQYLKQHPVTDADAQVEYDKVVAAQNADEYHAFHILVETEEQAKDLIAKIKGGAKFEDLAKAHSKDPGSGQRGGDLSWSPANNYVPEFAEALGKLSKGQMSDAPVKSQFGYHIIRVDDKRPGQAPAQIPAFEQVKDKIKEQMQQQKLGEYMKKLVDSAKVQ